MNPVPLQYFKAALAFHFLIHYTVYDKQESKEAGQDEVIDPFDTSSGAIDHGPVLWVMLGVLNAVRYIEDLVGSLPLRIILNFIPSISVVLVSKHGSS